MIGHEGVGTTNIKGGNTEHFVGIVFACLFEYLGGDWDGGVDGVADDGYNF